MKPFRQARYGEYEINRRRSEAFSLSQISSWKNLMRISMLLLVTLASVGMGPAIGIGQQTDLGSTATLEWIQGANRRDVTSGGVVSTEQILLPMVATSSKEPTPVFKYRFWPSRTSLKPGSAQTHFYRAVVNQYAAMQRMSKEQLQQLSSIQGLEIERIPIDEANRWCDRFIALSSNQCRAKC